MQAKLKKERKGRRLPTIPGVSLLKGGVHNILKSEIAVRTEIAK